MLRRLYDRMMEAAASRHAGLWLALVAFCEGVFFPIPPDVMLVPVVLARREHAWRYAAICTVASICGGCVGYSIGHFLHPVGHWILSLTGNADGLDKFQAFYARWGLLMLAMPIPYKLIAIASGFANFNLALFIGASAVLRGARFFLVAGLTRRYGAPVRTFVEKRLGLVVSAIALALVGAVMVLKFAL